ncbi:hypothetical protein [Kitasatospora cinereorecta]|uniref:Uncharacterized protein n=1 Tax=Kitasatospora cinereorecta TaxID=285560 RepID=A0ABW0V9A1_9ACTN
MGLLAFLDRTLERISKSWHEAGRIMIFTVILAAVATGGFILIAHVLSTGYVTIGAVGGLAAIGTGAGAVRRWRNRRQPPVDRLPVVPDSLAGLPTLWPPSGEGPPPDRAEGEPGDIPMPPPREEPDPRAASESAG